MMMRVTMYSRHDCPLCDEARTRLGALQGEIPHQLVEIDVDSDPVIRDRFGESVPVVQVGPYTLKSPFSSTDLRVALAAARDRSTPEAPLVGASRERAVRLNRGVLFVARHWLALLNLVLFLYVGLPFAAPVLMKIGATRPARWIYAAYSPLCHQLAFRSWFLFGEQAAYPRLDAGTSLIPYEQATGLDPNDVLAARAFLGNETLGYKVAFCQRDVAIYGGMLVAGLIFGLVRRWLKPLPIVLWLLIGVAPIALDGGTQLLGAFPFFSALARESTPFLRTLTGGLFGIMNVWMAYPYLEESMAETVTALVPKLAAVDRAAEPSPST
jgi:uncharacterized membrane protein